MTTPDTTHETEPVCRACYAATLSPSALERFNSEPVTGCVHYCPEHEAVQAALLEQVDWSQVIYRRPGLPFDHTPTQEARDA